MTEAKRLESLQSKAEKAKVSEAPVKTFMSRCTLLVPEKTKIFSAIQMLSVHNVGSAPVVDRNDQVVGVISEHDLLIQTATLDVIDSIQYKPDTISVAPDTKLKEVLVLMYKNKIRRIPVVDRDRFVIGIVTRMDILLKLIGKSRQ